ncbi:enoyl-CoA hydratase-related protein [Phenylobacterium montanum]|uniref:Enoyl-CoA hydratase/isomerase family protein n=1 Tax=Phenylobacterium montanum TaxID=2823693 RepID=A0A975FZP7_9CAUL|nr:enoyl-CoA hydratase-related protein [Caulobacter sp. S6]QUD88453.1 enoyl-CoA hydratase/isomerase family protein [Caulobacter sp. S6]
MTNPISDPLVENVISEEVTNAPVTLEATPDGVATVTLNRPHRRNAFDAPTILALTEIFETLQGAEGVRVVFLRGSGGSFSAGADLDWMRMAADWSEDDNRDDAMALAHMLKALDIIPMLTVALVEGSAFGGGVGLVAACDMAIATQDARFAFSEVKLGLTPATISPYVVRAVGARAATGLFATGSVFGADKALALGLVSEVVADAAALDAVKARLSSDIMACAPGAMTDAKQLVRDVAGREIDRALMDETARRIARARVSEEGKEGVAAFLGKRKPAWDGRA